MYRIIEALESRTLFHGGVPANVAADLNALQADGAALKATAGACVKSAASDVKLLTADMKRLKASKIDAALVAKLSKDEKTLLGKVRKDAVSAVSNETKNVDIMIADAKKLSKKSSPTLQAKLSADITRLESEAFSHVQTLGANVTVANTTEQIELSTIAATNPSDTRTQGHVTAAKAHSTVCVTSLNRDATQLLTGVSTLVANVLAFFGI